MLQMTSYFFSWLMILINLTGNFGNNFRVLQFYTPQICISNNLKSGLTCSVYVIGLLTLCWGEDRWEAGQTLARKLMLDLISKQQKGEELNVNSAFIEGIRSTVTNSSLDKVSRKVNIFLLFPTVVYLEARGCCAFHILFFFIYLFIFDCRSLWRNVCRYLEKVRLPTLWRWLIQMPYTLLDGLLLNKLLRAFARNF